MQLRGGRLRKAGSCRVILSAGQWNKSPRAVDKIFVFSRLWSLRKTNRRFLQRLYLRCICLWRCSRKTSMSTSVASCLVIINISRQKKYFRQRALLFRTATVFPATFSMRENIYRLPLFNALYFSLKKVSK